MSDVFVGAPASFSLGLNECEVNAVKTKSILIVDDEEGIRESLEKVLSKAGYQTMTASTGNEAFALLSERHVDIVLTDLKMPDGDGLDLLKLIKKKSPDLEVILLTGFGTIETAVEAMKEGAYDFITKPPKKALILSTVERAIERQNLAQENKYLRAQLGKSSSFEDIIGNSSAFHRVLEMVERVAPLVVGAAPISARGREREVPVLGTTADYLAVQNTEVTEGQFLPPGEIDVDRAVCVIGANVRRELFGDGPAIGESLRIGERRFRVVGVLASQGRSIGFDTQELVIVPVSAAQALFNSESLFRVLVQTRSRESMLRVRDQALAAIKARHQGEEDVTVITQDALLATFDRIFTALTLTLAGIASISLAVAGILVMNVMLVAVSQRTAEVGLLKALGATRRQVLSLFLTEALLLSLAGAVVGIAVGEAASWFVRKLYPALPLAAPTWAYVLAVITALVSGIVFGMLPARRAARLDPVEALSGRK